jgi:LPS-assembly protein
MRITLLNPMKYSLLTIKRCLCVWGVLFAVSVSANTEILASKPESDNTEQPRLSVSNNLDWVKKQDMSPEQQDLVAKFCCGAYIEPTRDYQDSDKHPDESALRVNAISTQAHSDNVAILEGDVNIAQGYRQIRSNSAIVDQENRRITLVGNIRFREPNMLLTGNHALLNLDSQEVEIENASYVLHQASVRGSAKVLRRQSNGLILIEDSSFTGCEPDVDSWKLQTSEIKLDQKSGFATPQWNWTIFVSIIMKQMSYFGRMNLM